jgi:ribosomal protein L16 Arg81 hydroxylase
MNAIGQRLLNETNLFYEDKPHFFKNLLPDVQEVLTWSDVEKCINNPALYNFEMIGADNYKIEIPMHKKAWVFSKPVQDKAFMIDHINQGYGFVIMDYGFYSEKTNHLLKIFESIYDVNAAIHVYGGLEGSKSFSIHEDYPANFIIQADGVTTWKVFNNRISHLYRTGTMNGKLRDEDLDLAFEVTLEPGDAIYIPARMYHKAMPEGKRLSMSIPCWSRIPTDPITEANDRNYYRINYGNKHIQTN